MDDTIWDLPYHVIIRAWLPTLKEAVAVFENVNNKQEAQQAAIRFNRIAWRLASDMGVYDELY